jgi:Uma2 family endonuclease
LTDEQIEEPPFAPDAAIEIRSPGDRDRNVALKASLYRSAGARVVLDVDPDRQQIVALAEDSSTTFAAGKRFVHQSLPGLTIDVTELFATTRRH